MTTRGNALRLNWALARLPRTTATRALFFSSGDVVLWGLSYYFAFLIRFDGVLPAEFAASAPAILASFIPVKLVWHALFRLYHVTWRLVGLTEILQVAKASMVASLTLAAGMLLLRDIPVAGEFPRSVLILDGLLGAAFIAAFRLSRRLWDEFSSTRNGKKNGIRVLLVGAGSAGEQLARAMLTSGRGRYRPVGFIDDDRAKHGAYVHGLRVLGAKESIPDVVSKLGVEEVIISIPSAPAAAVRDIVRYTRDGGIKRIKVLPGVDELLDRKVSLQEIRDVDLDDLLGRESVRLDQAGVSTFLAGRTVLVTGAGGSIGSELVRQLARLPVSRLIVLDSNESALFELQTELSMDGPTVNLQSVIADIRDGNKMERIFALWRPSVVYHAAAYKHVPMMEANVDEAVRTNILGTLTVAEAAVKSGCETFVLISTDKAVVPFSVMGATKRVAETVIEALNKRGATRFMAVRFGNVIGSRGSVLPLIQEQIRRGGPVTITNPEMTRYFMSTREAVGLVLQTSASRDPRDIFVLDMGRPVKILELAHELIRLSGYEPDKDMPIVYTGVRPGEKLHETLETPEEPLEPTDVPRVFAVDMNGRVDEMTLRLALQELDRLSRVMDAAGIREMLLRLAGSGKPIPAWLAPSAQRAGSSE